MVDPILNMGYFKAPPQADAGTVRAAAQTAQAWANWRAAGSKAPPPVLRRPQAFILFYYLFLYFLIYYKKYKKIKNIFFNLLLFVFLIYYFYVFYFNLLFHKGGQMRGRVRRLRSSGFARAQR